MAPTEQDPKPVEELIPASPAQEEQPADAVIVIRRDNPRGGLPIYDVLLNGNIQPESVQTALELGLKAWRERLGLAG